MKRKNPRLILLVLMLLAPWCACAVTFPDKPSSKHYYVDEAELIKLQTGYQINSHAAALLKEKRIPLYVAIVPSLAKHGAVNYSIEQYASELFNHWGIGWQDRNYGLLLLISKGDRKARIELGADWGREYDYQAKQVMDKLIVPAFKRGEFSTGITDGVRGLDAMARGLDLPEPAAPWWLLPVFIGGAIFVIVLIINLFKRGRSGWAWALIIALGLFLLFIIRNINKGSGGGFGGGSFGGGGATGSW